MEYLSNSLIFGAISSYFQCSSSPFKPLAWLTAIAACFLITTLLIFILKQENWKNSPPGPIGWPIVGILPQITQRFHEDLFHLSKKYGPLMSIKMGLKPAIVVSSPEMAYEVLKVKEASFSSRDITEAVRGLFYDAVSIVFVPYSPEWRVLRRILMTELFSTKSLQAFEPLRRKQVHGSLKELYSIFLSKGSVKIADVVFVTLGNLVSNLVVSENLFGSTNNVIRRELKQIFTEMIEILGTPNIADLIPIFKPLDPAGLKRKSDKLFKIVDPFYDELIDKRLEEKEKKKKAGEGDDRRKDMLDVLLEYRSDNKGDGFDKLPRNVIKGMLNETFIGATDTSLSTTEWAIAEILRNPNVYHKVLSELDQVVGKDRFVEETDINNLTYFQATIKEVFRLHPSIPLLIPRSANEACQVQGYNVPKNCIVYTNVWGMGRDPRFWDKPLEFRPERFLESSIDVKGRDFNLLPFGTGRRSCVGMPLGHRMVHFYVASLLHTFEWDFPNEVLDDMSEKVGLTLQKGMSLVGIPKPRLAESVYNC